MALQPPRICKQPACHQVTADPDGFCVSHKHKKNAKRRRYDRRRPDSGKRGYDARWQKYTKIRLHMHPLCEYCRREGRIVAATVTDHIQPHRGDRNLFWDAANHQSLCTFHHNQKSGQEAHQ